MIRVRIHGGEELKARLEELAKRKAKAILRGALRAAGGHLRDQIKAAAPVDTGTLRDAIRSGGAKGEGGQLRAKVFVSMKQKKPRKTGETRRLAKNGKLIAPFYWAFLEYGTRFRPARPFMRPVFRAEAEAAVDVAAAYARERIEKEA